jgi:hypothetical protein
VLGGIWEIALCRVGWLALQPGEGQLELMAPGVRLVRRGTALAGRQASGPGSLDRWWRAHGGTPLVGPREPLSVTSESTTPYTTRVDVNKVGHVPRDGV